MDSSLDSFVRDYTFEGWTPEIIIGEGASAVVFLASKGTSQAALKIFKPELVKKYGKEIQRARIERQLQLRMLSHPNLIKIFSGGEHLESKFFYLLMEYLPYRTLSKTLGQLPVHRIAPVIAQIASAAQFLEEHGFFHRDIKPDNIVVDQEFRRSVLLDVGVLLPLPAISLTDQQSDQRPFIGTTRYCPPEFLVRGERRDPLSYRAITFYQLGAVLHDMLTGRIMFHDIEDEPYTRLTNAVQHELPSFSPLRAGIKDRSLVQLAGLCLNKDPQQRLDSVTWQNFSYRRFARQPVVVFLYTGGTIGSIVSDDSTHNRDLKRVDDTSAEFLNSFRDRIVRDYQLIAGPDFPLPFDLVWATLPAEQQLLSENAQSESWENLTHAIEKICKEYRSNRKELNGTNGLPPYLAGIIVLHGTDTLAFSAAALAFSLQNLPCCFYRIKPAAQSERYSGAEYHRQ
jgi:serine/threonine protein kinase